MKGHISLKTEFSNVKSLSIHTNSLPQGELMMGKEPLNAQMLSQSRPEEQKQMLGEQLYPIIQSLQPELAGKITGMLLEMENSEILHMLEDSASLNSKVSWSSLNLMCLACFWFPWLDF